MGATPPLSFFDDIINVRLAIPVEEDYLQEIISDFPSTPSSTDTVDYWKKKSVTIPAHHKDLKKTSAMYKFIIRRIDEDFLLAISDATKFSNYLNLHTLEDLELNVDSCIRYNCQHLLKQFLEAACFDLAFVKMAFNCAIDHNNIEALKYILHSSESDKIDAHTLALALVQCVKNNNIKGIKLILQKPKCADIDVWHIEAAIYWIIKLNCESAAIKFILLLPNAKNINPKYLADLLSYSLWENDIESFELILQQFKPEHLNVDYLGKALVYSIYENNVKALMIFSKKLKIDDVQQTLQHDPLKLSLKIQGSKQSNLGVLLSMAALYNQSRIIAEILNDVDASNIDLYYLKLALLQAVMYNDPLALDSYLKNDIFQKISLEEFDYISNVAIRNERFEAADYLKKYIEVISQKST